MFIPKLGMTMEKAKIARWSVEDGSRVEKDDVVLVIETEKVSHEILAPLSGFVLILAEAGQELPCGAVVGAVAETQEEYEAAKKEAPSVAAAAGPDLEAPKTEPAAAPPEPSAPEESAGPVRISPVAKKIAEEHNLDVSGIQGSGPGGRITKKDVERALEAKEPEAETAAMVPVTTAAVAFEVLDGKEIRESIPLTGMRKAIAENLHRSHSVSAPVTAMSEIDMTEMIRLRRRYAEKADILGFRITYTDLLLFIVAKALKSVPIMNASLIGDEIKLWKSIHIGFAVSIMRNGSESGLVVPVIRDADKMSLGEISNARADLMERARTGRLSLDEMTGGTFTISNTGTFGSGWHIQTPIINQPESAILGTSSIVERPVVKDGEIVIRPIMPISLTFDHRIMDGAPSARFVNKIIQMTEDPDMIIV